MNPKMYELEIDLYEGIRQKRNIEFTVGDFGQCHLRFKVTAGAEAYNLTGTTVRMVINGQQQDCVVISAVEGTCKISLLQSMFNEVGIIKAQLQVYDSSQQHLRLTSPMFEYRVLDSLFDDDTVVATPDYSLLQSLIMEVRNTVEYAKREVDAQVKRVDVEVAKLTDIVKQSELTSKIQLDGVGIPSSINLKSNIAQEGLVDLKLEDISGTSGNAKILTQQQSDRDFTLLLKFVFYERPVSISADQNQFMLCSLYADANKDYIFINKTSLTTSNSTPSTFKFEEGKTYEVAIVHSSRKIHVYINRDKITEFARTTTEQLRVNGNRVGGYTVWKDWKGSLYYDHILTQREITHAFNVMGKSLSIPSLEITSSDGTKSEYELGRNDRITIDEEVRSNFNLLENKIVKEGLVVEINNVKTPPIKSSGFSIDISKDFTIIVKLEKILQGNIFSQVKGGEGSKRLGIALDYQDSTGSFRLFQGTDKGWVSNLIKSSANNPIAIIKNGDTITVIADSIISFTTAINPSENIASLGGAGVSTEGSYNINAYIHYNRALSQQEVQHIMSVLNNPKSISALETIDSKGNKTKHLLGSTEDVVEMGTGRTLRQEYMGLLKAYGKDFVADKAGKITVDNGLDARVISANIEGQTVKNCISYAEVEVNSTRIVVYPSNLINMKGLYVCNKTSKTVLYSLHNVDSGVWIKDVVVLANAYSKVDIDGKLSGIHGLFARGWTSSESDKEEFKKSLYIVQNELDFNALLKPIPFGLTSTKAIIENNGVKYPIYEPTVSGKTKVLKALKGTQDYVEISADEARDITKYDYKLESLKPEGTSEETKGLIGIGSAQSISDSIDRVSKVINSNTKEIVLDGSENWSKTATTSGYFRFYITVSDVLSSVNKTGVVCNEYVYESNTSIAIANKEKCVFVYQTTQQLSFIDKDKKDFTIEQWKQYLAQQKSNGTPVVVRYQLSTPLTVKLTEEQVKCYGKHMVVVELPFAEDKVKLNDDGSGTWIDASNEVTVVGSFVFQKWKENTNTISWYCICLSSYPSINNSKMLSTDIQTGRYSDVQSSEIELLGSNANNIGVSIPKTTATTAEQVLQYMIGKKFVYQLATPITTRIPKELVRPITTGKKNVFSIYSAISASKFELKAPIDLLSLMEARLKALEALTTSHSNLALVDNYLNDTHNEDKRGMI